MFPSLEGRGADGSSLPSWLNFDIATQTFNGTAPLDSNGSLDITVTASDGELEVEDTFVLDIAPDNTGGGDGDSSGFSLSSVNDWYDPNSGGGFNVTYEYTVSNASIVDEDLFAWLIDIGYSGSGDVVTSWTSSFNGPVVFFGANDSIGNVGQEYQPELYAGDSFLVSFQVNGAGFDADEFAPVFFDEDSDPIISSADDVFIDAVATNDWGAGFQQTVEVENLSQHIIDGWSILLDTPDGVSLQLNSVSNATAEVLANGDVQFTAAAWNEDIDVGGMATFGFTASYSGASSIAFNDDDFSWVV